MYIGLDKVNLTVINWQQLQRRCAQRQKYSGHIYLLPYNATTFGEYILGLMKHWWLVNKFEFFRLMELF